LRSFLLIAYFFLATFLSHVELIHEINLSRDDKKGNYILSTGTKTSNQTVVFYHGIFRDIIDEHMFNNSQDYKIGGLGLTVEVDESMFGKRKYRRGRITGRRQMWVLGGVCRETGECFLEPCPDNKRDRATLESLILKRVRPGTRVLTDGWSGYKHLEKLGFSWDYVNHSEHFRKPEDHSVHTNTIEGKWFVVKRQLPRSGAYDLERYLPVYLWKDKMKRMGLDPFKELLRLVANRQQRCRGGWSGDQRPSPFCLHLLWLGVS